MQVSISQAESFFPKLIDILESKTEDEVIIVRDGIPVAKITLINNISITQRIWIAEGKFLSPINFDADDKEIAKLFTNTIDHNS